MNVKQSKDNSFPRLLTEGLWVVGNYYFNLYVLKGEQGSALIEAGVSAVVDRVVDQLKELAVSPTFLVMTHPHADHATGLQGLMERFPDALVVAGEGAVEFLAHPKTGPLMVAEDEHMSQFLGAEGFDHRRPPVQEPPSLHHALIAKDQDEMDLGGITMRFLNVGGHSPGTIAVHVAELSALMPADSLGFRFPGRGIVPLFFTSYPDYMDTLSRLAQFDAAILGIPHQGPLTGDDVQAAFSEAYDTARALRDEIVADTREPEELARDLFERYYRDELTMYTPSNILNCMRLVIRRARESAQ
ncbi:MAG: MBL fold metallo-hydrolase [Thermodesulfobacteriota bacterium]